METSSYPVDPGLQLCINETQILLQGLIKHPEISPQLLAKPPVRFLRDVFVEVAKTTGCGLGVVDSQEIEMMPSSRENKLAFLTMLLHFVASAANEPLLLREVRVGKMAAGLEPEKTNLLLRRFHQAATNDSLRTRWKDAVRTARLAWETCLVALRAEKRDGLATERDASRGRAAQGMPLKPVAPPGGGDGPSNIVPSDKQPLQLPERKVHSEIKAPQEPRSGTSLRRNSAPAPGIDTLTRIGHSLYSPSHVIQQQLLTRAANISGDQSPKPLGGKQKQSGVSVSVGVVSPTQAEECTRLQPTQPEIELWVSRLLRDGLDGLGDARLSNLACSAARLQRCAEDLMEKARQDQQLMSIFSSEMDFWRLIRGYVEPSILTPQAPHSGKLGSASKKCNAEEQQPRRKSCYTTREGPSRGDEVPMHMLRPAESKQEHLDYFRRQLSAGSSEPPSPAPSYKRRQSRKSMTGNIGDVLKDKFVMLVNDKCGLELIDAMEKMMKDSPIDLNRPIESTNAYPLHYAVAFVKNPGLVKLLVSFRADVRNTYDGAQDWFGVQPGQTALDYATMKKNDHHSEKWDVIEEILKSEIDKIRGWDTGRRSTRALTYTKAQLDRLSNQLSDSSENSDYDAEAQKQKYNVKRNNKGHRPSVRSLYQTRAGFCAHMEQPPTTVYDLEEKVGEGAFGCVRRGVHKQSGALHAIKALPKMLLDELNLWSEIAIMRQIDHPHILKLYATFEDPHSVYMACELCTGGQLFDAIIEEGAIRERTCAIMMKQIVAAVYYLHQRYICHRDLKPENFMLHAKTQLDECLIKLIDFGTAKRFDLEKMTTKVCTVHYVAPELLKNQLVPYTEKCDIWSCGVIMYVMLCGCPPFDGETDMEVLQSVKKGKFDYKPKEVWDLVSQDAQTMIKKMLTVKPKDRYSAKQVARDKWTQELAPNAMDQSTANAQILGKMRAFQNFNKLKKVALQVIAQQLSDESHKQLRDNFLALDSSMKGALTTDEMAQVIKSRGFDEKTQIELIDMMFDLAGEGGEINYTKYLAANLDKQVYLRDEACKAAFTLFDVDGDGVISRMDLDLLFGHNQCQEVGEDASEKSQEKAQVIGDRAKHLVGVSRQEIERIIAESDKDGNEQIDFAEFKEMMATKTMHMDTEFGAEIDMPWQGVGDTNPKKQTDSSTKAADGSAEKPGKVSSIKKSPTRKLEVQVDTSDDKADKPQNSDVDISSLVPVPHHDATAAKNSNNEEGEEVIKRASKDSQNEDEESTKKLMPKSQMMRSPTVIFGKKGPRKNLKSDQQDDGSSGQVEKKMSDRPDDFYPEMEGPNPLWEILKQKNIDIPKLKEILAGDTVRYVNTPLDREGGVPPALFLAVTLRSVELVNLLVRFRGDVRKRFEGQKVWKGVKVGSNPIEFNQSQKNRYVGTFIFDKCEAIDSILKAEEDRLRGWKEGRRASTAARRYFHDEAERGSLCISQEEAEKEELQMINKHVKEEMTEAEKALAKKTLYGCESTYVTSHVSEDPRGAYDLGQLCGEGTFGTVFMATEKSTGLEYAIKSVPKTLLEESDLWEEIDLMRDMDHPYVAKLFATYEDDDSLYLVMENCRGGELFHAIIRKGMLTEYESAKIFDQMLVAIGYLHNRLICHRDVKPENFLLSSEGPLEHAVIKLIDFGTACRYEDRDMTTKICTIHYVAPEILARTETPYSERVDCWSLGVCLFLMLCGSPPFSGDNDNAVLKKVKKGKFAFEPEEHWEGISDGPKNLITKLLSLEPDDRPPIKDAANDQWLKHLLTVRRSLGGEVGVSIMKSVLPKLVKFEKLSWFQRISMRIVTTHLPEKSVRPLRDVWFKFDQKNKGHLNATDVLASCAPICAGDADLEAGLNDLVQCIKREDSLGDCRGDISFTTFLAAMLERDLLLDQQACLASFIQMDLDEDGAIGLNDLNIVLQGMQMHVQSDGTFQFDNISKVADGADTSTMSEVEQIMQRFDMDATQKLTLEAFLKMLQLEGVA